MMTGENIFTTELQAWRAKRNVDICDRYTALRTEQPLVSRNRVLCVVAGEYKLHPMSVKVILRRANLYK